MPVSPSLLALFIAYLYKKQYACSTVNTYVSAISYSYKLSGWADPSKVFFVTQLLKSYGKKQVRLDCCLPITLPFLHQLIAATDHMSLSLYDRCLMKAMCLFAFFTFSRIGEITTNQTGNTLQLNQISMMVDDTDHMVSIRVEFQQFKHSYNQRPFSLTVSCRARALPCRAFFALHARPGHFQGSRFPEDRW